MQNNVILNKIQVIERCIKRIKEVYADNPENLKDYTKQDSIILNIQRACEATIDLAMHVVSEKGLGIPQTSREAFQLLEEEGIIAEPLATRLKGMVGFRNIAIHDYQAINLDIVKNIIDHHLQDFTKFAEIVLKL